MKHFTLLFAAAALTVASAVAGVPAKKSLMQNPAKITNTTSLNRETSKALNISHRDFDPAKVKTMTPRLSRDAVDNTIYVVEGEAQSYIVNSLGFSVFFGFVYFEPGSTMKEIVWGEDGDVYIKGLINCGLDYYIR